MVGRGSETLTLILCKGEDAAGACQSVLQVHSKPRVDPGFNSVTNVKVVTTTEVVLVKHQTRTECRIRVVLKYNWGQAHYCSLFYLLFSGTLDLVGVALRHLSSFLEAHEVLTNVHVSFLFCKYARDYISFLCLWKYFTVLWNFTLQTAQPLARIIGLCRALFPHILYVKVILSH